MIVKEYYDFINELDLPDYLKNNFVDDQLLKESHKFYINLFEYLQPLYPSVVDTSQLTLAAYLHFRFLLIFDNYLDATGDKQRQNFEQLFLGLELYEKSTRVLSDLIKDQQFWKAFRQLKKEYFSTVKLEKIISEQQVDFSRDLFKKIAIGKSAICLASVQALESLGGPCNNKAKIIECLEHIHLAFQIVDDIDDFQKDIKEGQWTFIRFQLHQHIKQSKFTFDSTELLVKYLYSSGIAQTALKEASTHYVQAISIAKSLLLNDLKNYLEEQNKKLEVFTTEIGFLKEKTLKKLNRSIVFKSGNSLHTAINSGIEFIGNNISKEGYWNDFYTSAGEGGIWTSAYVGFQIAEYDNRHSFLQQALKNLNSQNSSFNENIFQDGDSMTFAIAFRNAARAEVFSFLKNQWFDYLNDDGGWVTYRGEKQLREQLEIPQDVSVKGWLNAQTCVSSAAAYVLSKLGVCYREQFHKTARYLISQLKTDGFWESYWWTSPVYATSYAVLALNSSDEYSPLCEKPVNWLLSQQNECGFWRNEATGKESPFYTALAVKAIASYNYSTNKLQIQKALHWLLERQTTDGSWISNHILRIPSTQVEDPLLVDRWRKSSFGVNCIVDDHNRFFSTSAIVNALKFILILSRQSPCL